MKTRIYSFKCEKSNKISHNLNKKCRMYSVLLRCIVLITMTDIVIYFLITLGSIHLLEKSDLQLFIDSYTTRKEDCVVQSSSSRTSASVALGVVLSEEYDVFKCYIYSRDGSSLSWGRWLDKVHYGQPLFTLIHFLVMFKNAKRIYYLLLHCNSLERLSQVWVLLSWERRPFK